MGASTKGKLKQQKAAPKRAERRQWLYRSAQHRRSSGTYVGRKVLTYNNLKRHSPLYILMPVNLNAPALLHPLLAKISRTVRTRVCSRDASCIRLRRITSVSKKTPARAAFLPRAVPRHSSKTMHSKAIENFQKQQKTTKR